MQVEQQDNILTQLQQELKAERERHADTGRHLQKTKKSNCDLQDDIDNYHKQVGDLATTVSPVQWGTIITDISCMGHFMLTYRDKPPKIASLKAPELYSLKSQNLVP